MTGPARWWSRRTRSRGRRRPPSIATAIADGWSSVRPGDRRPAGADGRRRRGHAGCVRARGPRSDPDPGRRAGPGRRTPVSTSWLLLPPSDEYPGGVGVVELASTSGITLLDELAPLDAHTLGFGQAIADALDHGVSRLLLAIGGSASTDGGVGALAALGGTVRRCSAPSHPPRQPGSRHRWPASTSRASRTSGCRGRHPERRHQPAARSSRCRCGLRAAEGRERGAGAGSRVGAGPARTARAHGAARRPSDDSRRGCGRWNRVTACSPGAPR